MAHPCTTQQQQQQQQQRLDPGGQPVCELCGRRLNRIKWKRRHGPGYVCHPQCRIKKEPPSSKDIESRVMAGVIGLTALASAGVANNETSSEMEMEQTTAAAVPGTMHSRLNTPKIGTPAQLSTLPHMTPPSASASEMLEEIIEPELLDWSAAQQRSHASEGGQPLLARVPNMLARYEIKRAANGQKPSVQLAAEVRKYIQQGNIPPSATRLGISTWDLIALSSSDSRAARLRTSIEALMQSKFEAWLTDNSAISTITIMQQNCDHPGQPARFNTDIGYCRSILLYCSPAKGTEFADFPAGDMDAMFQEYATAAKNETAVSLTTVNRSQAASNFHQWTANPGDLAIFEHTNAYRDPPHRWPFIDPLVLVFARVSPVKGNNPDNNKQVVIGEMGKHTH